MHQPTTKDLRLFGFAFALVGIIVATRLAFKQGWEWGSTAGSIFALTMASAALWDPRILRPFHALMGAIARFVGTCLLMLMLAVLWYVVVTPIGIMMRLAGRDLLDEKIERARTSYWKLRPERPFEKKSYTRQF